MLDNSLIETKPEDLVVQKFGGTSVGTAERMLNVANIVANTLKERPTIVVLSAMSSQKKSEGTTSRLIQAMNEVLTPESKKFLDIVDLIQTSHIKTAELAIPQDSEENKKICEELQNDINTECENIKKFMKAAEIIDEISPRSNDIIISTGEKLAARTLTAVLVSQGIDAEYVNLEKLIEKEFDENNITQSFYDYIAERLGEVTKACGKKVPVVTGYFGPVPGSILQTIGRGYTDLTAALIAVGRKAGELQIWKEVDGIFTADPRKAPKARLLSYITPEEAAELTYYGSEVIHPTTMEQVIRVNIPIRIKNTFKPEGFGTVITPDAYDKEKRKEDAAKFTRRNGTAVTIKDDVTIVNIHSNRKSLSYGFMSNVFAILSRYGISVDLISTSEVHISMALANVQSKDLERALKELKKYGNVQITTDMSILSLVGKQMKNLVGTAGRMFTTLAAHNVNIEMISQGASEINISCVISADSAPVALRAVHDECVLGLPIELPM